MEEMRAVKLNSSSRPSCQAVSHSAAPLCKSLFAALAEELFFCLTSDHFCRVWNSKGACVRVSASLGLTAVHRRVSTGQRADRRKDEVTAAPPSHRTCPEDRPEGVMGSLRKDR